MSILRSLRLSRGLVKLSLTLSRSHIFTFIILSFCILHQYTCHATDYSHDLFTRELFGKYAVNDTIGVEDLDTLLQNVRSKYVMDVMKNFYLLPHEGNVTSTLSKSCVFGNGTRLPDCIQSECLSGYDTFHLYNITHTTRISLSQFGSLLPAILFEAQKHDCELSDGSILPPQSEKVWGYGILFVTIINICSMGGALVLPFTKKSIYKQVMTFLVGLAVGSLAATGLMVLIPEALHLFHTGQSRLPLVLKATTIFGGVYLFFLIERMLKVLMAIRQRKQHEDRGDCLTEIHNLNHHHANHNINDVGDLMCSIKAHAPQNVTDNCKRKDVSSLPDTVCPNCMGVTGDRYKEVNGCGDKGNLENSSSRTKMLQNGHSHTPTDTSPPDQVATIAWMIIFGDGLHNFIDGLSIGAAFTQNILTGVSVSVAVICEEIPHELGDFAILLKAGMTYKQAMFFNFLSACTCYLGLIFGIVLGENTSSHEWIFALAGGMFLYISLVDMLPEMNSSAEEEERLKNTVCSLSIFLLQNLGIIVGFAIITVMTLYAESIDFEGH